ncbi:MAG: SusC/RagA family TonB-linked outer membrane protein, partial [Urechidicola sp.]|nr:SusC/RagA family TonB-linked outer membrane protein [Urechidicola sp.]
MCKHVLKFKLRQIALVAFVFIGLNQSVWAQRQTITGSVKSESGEVLPGVTILTKESKTTGTATDFDGNFTLRVPEKVNTLIFSYVGFTTQEVLMNGKTNFQVVLLPSSDELDEVVVVGYGTQKRQDVTGSIASVKEVELERTVNANLGDALVGRVAGVQVLSDDGTPGGGFRINIRGASSISGSTQPLYVVDGFPIEVFEDDRDLDTGYEGGGTSDPLDFLDPALIESIEILKDASATAIYGARGANGVVIVTTKQGKAGKTKINYTVSGSISDVPDARVQNMLSTSEYFDYQTARRFYGPDNRSWDATNEEWVYANPDISTFTLENPYPEDPSDPDQLTREQWNEQLDDTDWPREILRTGLLVNHVLSVSGGGEKNQYNYTGSYLKNEGVAIGSGYDRFVLNVNLKNKFSDRLSAQTTLSPTVSSQYGTGGGGSSVRNSWGPFTRAMNTAPYALVGESYVTEDDYDDISDNPRYQDPVYQLENEINNNDKYGFRGMTKWTYKITDHLKAVVDVGVRYDHQEQRQYNPPGFGIGKKGAGGRARRVDRNGWSWNNSNLLNYNRKFGKHRIDLTGVYTQQSKRAETYTQQATGFDESVEDGSTDFDLASEYNVPKIRIQEIKQTGLLGRVNYTYDNRYSVTASLRRDGDSRFAKNPDNIYRNFPAFGVAWSISNEQFMSGAKFLDNWKLRLSYGKSGNSGTRPRDSREAFVPL